MKLLRIDSSARHESVSRKLTSHFAETWKKQNPGGVVVERDLALTNLPLVSDEWVASVHTDPSKRTPAQLGALAISDELIAEIKSADVIVIGAPMYNFMISSSLKAWIDQVVRVGVTFAYGANGPHGLLSGKKVFVLTARGGGYRPGSPAEKFDFQEPYLRHVLGFIGLSDVTFVHAENQGGASAGAMLTTALEHTRTAAAH